MRTVFLERLDRGLGIAEIRRRVGKTAAGATRVRKPERQPMLRQWGMTIAEVYLPDQPERAVERVRARAAAIQRGLASPEPPA